MIDSPKKQPDTRIRLFDPVGLLTCSYRTPGRRATRSDDGGSPLRFAVESESGGDSGASSPRLWKAPAQDSRAQAIARGRREMMEMIKDMPESNYELSLRDMVDKQPPSPVADDSKMRLKSEGRKKKVAARSRSFDNGGFLLKTSVFPISFWLKKRSGRDCGSERKLGVLRESEIGEISTRNESRSSSSSSSTTSRRWQSDRFLPDCFSFKDKK